MADNKTQDAVTSALNQAAQDSAPDSSQHTIRLVIVDDQPLIRRGLAMMLGSEPDIEVVATAKDGQQAIEIALETSPDVIIMDLQMPGTDGVAATREITSQRPGTRVVVLTTFDHDDLVFEAIRAGAQAYLLKDATETQVLETVKAVHRGESYLSPSVARKVMSQFRTLSDMPGGSSPPGAVDSTYATKPATDGSLPVPERGHKPGSTSETVSAESPATHLTEEPLTKKEEVVLGLLAQGKSNRQIATEIDLAEGTVKNYVSRIMEKLHAQSRTELAVRAVSRRQ